jgi:hypothetical protein
VSGEPAPPEESTHEVDARVLMVAGQRRVNMIWELTQAAIAISVTIAVLVVGASLALSGESSMTAFLFMSNTFSLIIGFYFSRTNHTQIGGTGSKPRPPYEGR